MEYDSEEERTQAEQIYREKGIHPLRKVPEDYEEWSERILSETQEMRAQKELAEKHAREKKFRVREEMLERKSYLEGINNGYDWAVEYTGIGEEDDRLNAFIDGSIYKQMIEEWTILAHDLNLKAEGEKNQSYRKGRAEGFHQAVCEILKDEPNRLTSYLLNRMSMVCRCPENAVGVTKDLFNEMQYHVGEMKRMHELSKISKKSGRDLPPLEVDEVGMTSEEIRLREHCMKSYHHAARIAMFLGLVYQDPESGERRKESLQLSSEWYHQFLCEDSSRIEHLKGGAEVMGMCLSVGPPLPRNQVDIAADSDRHTPVPFHTPEK